MSPTWKINFSFGSIDPGFAKGDREAYRSIQQQVVVCKVVHIAEIRIHVHADLPHEPLRQAQFVVVAMRWLYRQAQHVGVQSCNLGGTRQQDVFKTPRLKTSFLRGSPRGSDVWGARRK